MNSGSMKLVIFVALTIMVVALSWRSLRSVGSHGFYRFFAWEAIVVLVFVNIGAWFRDPVSIPQLASWVLLFLSLVVVALGTYELMLKGKPSRHRQDATLMDFEKTSVLVTSGIYSRIRHPLYGSLVLLTWGVCLKDVTLLTVGLALVASIFLFLTAKADEKECIRFFGGAYAEYMKTSEMFIPFCL
jgi:protein-S-isoprenylcysteine O-methyltransferase Ste14